MHMRASEELFDTIDVHTVSEAVIAQIETLLVDGVLRSGQRLPPERELAERLGVSRLKLRDALEQLEARGLVVARHGDGTYVAALIGTALSPAMLELFARHPTAFVDYLEFRRETEGYAAFLAAQRATETDRSIIQRIAEAMRVASAAIDAKREADLDVRFHGAIVDAAHNAMLSHMMASIYDLMARGVFYNRGFLYRRADGRERMLEQHLAIAEAVLDQNPERAAAAAEAHVDFVRAAFKLGGTEQLRERVARKRLALLDLESSSDGAPRRRKSSAIDRPADDAG